MSKLYPIGIQNFESLRNDGYLYIDKTRLIYQLVKTGRYYFLSRPRRFGKSLLISTLEAYYQGKKELFEGLAIEQLEKDWIKHPILHLDLNIEKYDTPESLDQILNDNLEHWESLYGTRPSEVSFSLRFAGIIQRGVSSRSAATDLCISTRQTASMSHCQLRSMTSRSLRAHLRQHRPNRRISKAKTPTYSISRPATSILPCIAIT